LFVPGKVSGASASTELPKSYPEWAAALAEAAAAAVAAAPPKAPAAQTAPTATVPVENDIKEKQAANVEAARAWWMGEGHVQCGSSTWKPQVRTHPPTDTKDAGNTNT